MQQHSPPFWNMYYIECMHVLLFCFQLGGYWKTHSRELRIMSYTLPSVPTHQSAEKNEPIILETARLGVCMVPSDHAYESRETS